jgi:glycosyltransferase involved in cell wall biosynthesis
MNLESGYYNKELAIVIPVKNEEVHIIRAIKSALRITKNVVVVDSSSTDRTVELALSLGVIVLEYEWNLSSNFSKKMNWAFQNLPINATWIIRLDADEYFEESTVISLAYRLSKLDPKVNAVSLRRRVHFRGKWMRYGGQYPITNIRIIRAGCAIYESRWLDETVQVDGDNIVDLALDFVDDSLISISKWIIKHDKYSNQEAIETLNLEIGFLPRVTSEYIGKQSLKAQRRKRLYSKLPPLWRAFIYFFIRFFIKLGFLDGVKGFLWNFLQAWWYRTIVDIKIAEIKKTCGSDKEKILKYIENEYGIQI